MNIIKWFKSFFQREPGGCVETLPAEGSEFIIKRQPLPMAWQYQMVHLPCGNHYSKTKDPCPECGEPFIGTQWKKVVMREICIYKGLFLHTDRWEEKDQPGVTIWSKKDGERKQEGANHDKPA